MVVTVAPFDANPGDRSRPKPRTVPDDTGGVALGAGSLAMTVGGPAGSVTDSSGIVDCGTGADDRAR